MFDAGTVIRSTAGFANASNFSGACRDNQGNYWTTCDVSGQRVLVRLSPALSLVTGFLVTGIGWPVQDLAFDGLRSRLWIAAGPNVHVYDATTWMPVGSPSMNLPSSAQPRGIAWDGQDQVIIGGSSLAFDAQTLQLLNVSSNQAYGVGVMYYPPSGLLWSSFDSIGDPGQFTRCAFNEHKYVPAIGGVGATMPPHLYFQNWSYPGGWGRGCEQWFDTTTNEWLAVCCQIDNPYSAVLYTCRLGAATELNCGGPVFMRGPSVVQSHLFANAAQANGFTWLAVAFGGGNVPHPIFAPGCTLLLDPSSTLTLGAYLPSVGGTVSAGTTVPISPVFQDMALYYQWATLGLTGFYLSEMRSSAVKQF